MRFSGQYQWRHMYETVLYQEVSENGFDHGDIPGGYDLAGMGDGYSFQ